jgi:ribosomal protein RSM22 (predicted rRNA methylase)
MSNTTQHHIMPNALLAALAQIGNQKKVNKVKKAKVIKSSIEKVKDKEITKAKRDIQKYTKLIEEQDCWRDEHDFINFNSVQERKYPIWQQKKEDAEEIIGVSYD